MSEKHLTEPGWKSIVSKQKLKDPGLGKALGVLAECAETDHPARLKALGEIEKHAENIKKEHKKEAEIADYLDEVLKEAGKLRKSVELLKKNAESEKGEKEEEKEDEKEEEDDDDETSEFKADIGKKLTTALGQVKSRAPGAPEPGEEMKKQLRFAAYVASKGASVLIGQSISGGSKKLLPGLAGGAAGGTYYHGECIFEKGAHTFLLETVPGGLAKKLFKAIRAETGKDYKVRVRSLDGLVELDSDTDTETDVGTDQPNDLAAQWKQLKLGMYPEIKKALESNSPNRGEIQRIVGEANEHEKASDFQAAIDSFTQLRRLLEEGAAGRAAIFQTRLDEMTGALDRVLSANLGDTGKMRAVADFAREKAAAGNFDSALKALDALEKLISQAGEPGDGDDGRNKVNFAKLRLEWDARKIEVAGQLESLRKKIIADYKDQETLDSTIKLERILAGFDLGLGDNLDNLYTAGDQDSQRLYREKSAVIVDQYIKYVEEDPLITHVDVNPFTPVTVRQKLAGSLKAIEAALQAGEG